MNHRKGGYPLEIVVSLAMELVTFTTSKSSLLKWLVSTVSALLIIRCERADRNSVLLELGRDLVGFGSADSPLIPLGIDRDRCISRDCRVESTSGEGGRRCC